MTTNALNNNDTSLVHHTITAPINIPMPQSSLDSHPFSLKDRGIQVLKIILYPLILINNLFKNLVLAVLTPVIFGPKKLRTTVDLNLKQQLIQQGGQELLLQASKSRTLEALYISNPLRLSSEPSSQALIGRDKVVILFTGSHTSYELQALPLVNFYLSQGYEIMCVNPAGFGKSQGTCSQNTLEEAARLSYHYVRNIKNFSDDKIVAHGYSLGTYPAAYIAGKHKLNKLVLDRGFSKVSSVARDEAIRIFGSKFHGFVAKHLTKYGVPLDVAGKLEKVKSDVVIIQGQREQAVPYHKELLIASFAKGQNKTPAELFQRGQLEAIDLPIPHFLSTNTDLLPLFEPVVQALASRTIV